MSLATRLKHARSRRDFHKARLRFWRTRVADLAKALAAAQAPKRWYPPARKLPRPDAGAFTVGRPKGVLHTTEGSGDATATLDASRSHPHFQVETGGRVTQYIALDRGARALIHPAACETNRAHAVQIEVCGFAGRPDWPDAQVTALRALMRFIEANAGVGRSCTVRFVGGGQTNHLSVSGWLDYNGWCGHQHVPGNSHWDPGQINPDLLIK